MNKGKTTKVEYFKGYLINIKDMGCKHGKNCFECELQDCVYGDYDAERNKTACDKWRRNHMEDAARRQREWRARQKAKGVDNGQTG